MTSVLERPVAASVRQPRPRHFLMCPPRHFDVSYAINPWMDPSVPVVPQRASEQWAALVQTFRRHGHLVDLLEPVPGLPDMVFAANGATVVDGRVLEASFARPERRAEAGWHAAWHRSNGAGYGLVEQQAAGSVNEAEGDFAVLRVPGPTPGPDGSPGPARVLAGHGFRTSVDAHRELARLTGAEVVSLRLIDPRFYHLDVALSVLDDEAGLIAYYPPAFDDAARAELARLCPDALIATEADALAFGLNCVSDGLNVFVPVGAQHLIGELAQRDFRPVEVDLSELQLAGGSVKCCTQEIRPTRSPASPAQAETSAPIESRG